MYQILIKYNIYFIRLFHIKDQKRTRTIQNIHGKCRSVGFVLDVICNMYYRGESFGLLLQRKRRRQMSTVQLSAKPLPEQHDRRMVQQLHKMLVYRPCLGLLRDQL